MHSDRSGLELNACILHSIMYAVYCMHILYIAFFKYVKYALCNGKQTVLYYVAVT